MESGSIIRSESETANSESAGIFDNESASVATRAESAFAWRERIDFLYHAAADYGAVSAQLPAELRMRHAAYGCRRYD